MADHVQSTQSIRIESRAIETSDAALFAACRSGDQSAWDELIERYQRLLFAIPRRAGLSEDESSDVFQEVFATLFEKLDEIEQPEKIRSWIVTTAKFKTWGVIRGPRGKFTALDEEEMEYEMANLRDAAPLADDTLIELEQQHIIRGAVRQLDERCRKILSMIYLRNDPASYAEVAGEIGVGETSVSPLRARCLKKLEKMLKK